MFVTKILVRTTCFRVAPASIQSVLDVPQRLERLRMSVRAADHRAVGAERCGAAYEYLISGPYRPRIANHRLPWCAR